jgi:hypothetical protein
MHLLSQKLSPVNAINNTPTIFLIAIQIENEMLKRRKR